MRWSGLRCLAHTPRLPFLPEKRSFKRPNSFRERREIFFDLICQLARQTADCNHNIVLETVRVSRIDRIDCDAFRPENYKCVPDFHSLAQCKKAIAAATYAAPRMSSGPVMVWPRPSVSCRLGRRRCRQKSGKDL